MDSSRTVGLLDQGFPEAERAEVPTSVSASLSEAFQAAELTREPGKYAELGDLLVRAGRLVEAETAYREAISLPGGNYVRHRDALADILERLDRVNEAIAVVEQTIELDPGRQGRFLHLAKLWVRAKNYKRANAAVHRGLSINPTSAQAHAAAREITTLINQMDKTKTHLQNDWVYVGFLSSVLGAPGVLIALFPELTLGQIMDDNWILFNLSTRLLFGTAFCALLLLGIVATFKGLRGTLLPTSRFYKFVYPERWVK